ncbi:MAG: peptide ABC transporter substrate-binding protein, partial [Deltaproteobacteria bacterium]|nr:peptide ABC transporter substrate-binding protein [Deltaproteobacteria bacterium]
HIVTSGPFHLDAWVERDYIRLVKSKSYWNSELPKLDKITIYSMNDQGANANYYYRGHCDAVTSNNIPTSYLPFVNGARRPSGKPFKDYKAAPYLGSYFYIFNTEKLDNVHLRRALSHAIDRRPLPKILHGGQIPTHQYVPGTPISQLSAEDRKLCGVEEDDDRVAMIVEAGKLCYVPPAGPRFDLAKAKEELALAKKQMGKRFPDKISLKFNSGVEGHKLIAEYIQHEWQDKLDITIELNVQEWKTYLKATKGGEYQVGRMGWIGSYLDPEQNYMKNFKCDNPQNRPRWCSEKFDALFKRIEATADRRERLRMLAEAEEMMISEAPIMPLYVYTQHHLQKPYVKGLKVNLADRVLFQYVTLDAGWKARAE